MVSFRLKKVLKLSAEEGGFEIGGSSYSVQLCGDDLYFCFEKSPSSEAFCGMHWSCCFCCHVWLSIGSYGKLAPKPFS